MMRLLFAVCALAASTAQAQLSAGRNYHPFHLQNGVRIVFGTSLHNTPAGTLDPAVFGDANPSGNSIYRALKDSRGRPQFGYQLAFERTEKQVRASVAPLRPHVRFFPKAPEPKVLDDGDCVEFTLMENPVTGERLVDYFRVSMQPGSLRACPEGGDPSELTLDSLHMYLKNYRVVKNGQTIHRGGGGVNGNYLILHLPGAGGIAFTLQPQEGYDMRPDAILADDRIRFQIGADHYELVSAEPILQKGGPWKIFMYHDPSYVRRQGEDRIGVITGGPRLRMRD